MVALDKPRGAGVVPSGPPTVNTSFDIIDELTAGVSFMDELARESYSSEELAQPGTFTYTVVMPTSRDAIAGYVWCTTTREILDDNWDRMEFYFELNGEPIAPDEMSRELVSSANGPCYTLTALLTDWPTGEHSFIADINFTSDLNDGFGDYDSGHYRSEFTIYVER